MGSKQVAGYVLLLCVWLYLAWPQRCGAAESYEFVGLDRVAGDNVYVFNFAWVEGEDACEWQPWVGSMMGVNSSPWFTGARLGSETNLTPGLTRVAGTATHVLTAAARRGFQ